MGEERALIVFEKSFLLVVTDPVENRFYKPLLSQKPTSLLYHEDGPCRTTSPLIYCM